VKGNSGQPEKQASFLIRPYAELPKKVEGLAKLWEMPCLKPDFGQSLLASAARLNVPATVHVAMGTDIIHIHPGVDGAATGKASHYDFRLFCSLVAKLDQGVLLHAGSAVLLPEVFLKALTLVRNLGCLVREFTTANFDFIRHYRPLTNVVHRPNLEGGQGFNLISHHEIMLPLLAASILDSLEKKADYTAKSHEI
jgi:hypothetical protein